MIVRTGPAQQAGPAPDTARPGPIGRDTGGRHDYPRQFAQRRDAELPEEMRWLPQLYRSTTARLDKLQRHAEKRYPGVFDLLDHLHQEHRDQWPNWCWVPIGSIRMVLEQRYPQQVANAPRPPGLPEHLSRHLAARDAARLAALGAWRHSGRHIVNFHDSCTARFEADADHLPRELPARWPLLSVYQTLEAPGGSSGLFLYLEWDQIEQRTELRLLMDLDQVAAFDMLQAQPLFLTCATVTEALATTYTATVMRGGSLGGSEEILDISPDSEFDIQVRRGAQHVGVWVAAADLLASCEVVVTDAAQVLDRRPAGETWPPSPKPGACTPLLWVAAHQSLYA